MTLTKALKRMKSNAGLKMWMPYHYKNWQYLYYDSMKKKIMCEDGTEFEETTARYYNETSGYEDYDDYEH